MQPSARKYRIHTAYAILSPLGSEDKRVGWPRVVVGEAAQIASAMSRQTMTVVEGAAGGLPEVMNILFKSYIGPILRIGKVDIYISSSAST